jgi:hypothetical protein
MITSSKDVISDDAPKGANHILEKVYDMHRRSSHYSVKKTQEKIYIMNLAEVEKYHIFVVEEAFKIYKEKGQPRPHPNYFMAICRRLNKEFKETGNFEETEPKQIWGKTI